MICGGDSAPGSRRPSARDPTAKSAPSAIASRSRTHCPAHERPVAVGEQHHVDGAERAEGGQAGDAVARGLLAHHSRPASRARCAVASVEPLSQTTKSSTSGLPRRRAAPSGRGPPRRRCVPRRAPARRRRPSAPCTPRPSFRPQDRTRPVPSLCRSWHGARRRASSQGRLTARGRARRSRGASRPPAPGPVVTPHSRRPRRAGCARGTRPPPDSRSPRRSGRTPPGAPTPDGRRDAGSGRSG